MNKGMRRLNERGLVMFLNAGDWLASPSILESIDASYESHGWRWSAGTVMVVDASGQPMREMVPRSPSRPLFMVGLAPVPHPAAVFSRALLDEIGEYDPRAGIAADQHYMLRCWLTTPPFALRTVVANFNLSGASSKVGPGFTARQMRTYRLEFGKPLLGSASADHAITNAVIGTSTIASIVQPQLRVRRLLARLHGLRRSKARNGNRSPDLG
jgi:hypothetical protein